MGSDNPISAGLQAAGNAIGGGVNVVKNPLSFLGGTFGTALTVAKDQLIDQPKAQAQDKLRVQKDQMKAVQDQIDEQDRKTALTKERDEKRARQRAEGSAGLGRAGTILTGPLGQVGGVDAANSKTILGG